MIKTVLSLAAAFSLLAGAGYNPSMTEINRVDGQVEALRLTASGAVAEEDIYTVERRLETDVYTNLHDG